MKKGVRESLRLFFGIIFLLVLIFNLSLLYAEEVQEGEIQDEEDQGLFERLREYGPENLQEYVPEDFDESILEGFDLDSLDESALESFNLDAINRDRDEDMVEGVGRVEFVDVEGGCWRIVVDGVNYEPSNLPEEFREDNLRVEVGGVLLEDAMSVCQVGIIFEILEIEIIEEGDYEEEIGRGGEERERARERVFHYGGMNVRIHDKLEIEDDEFLYEDSEREFETNMRIRLQNGEISQVRILPHQAADRAREALRLFEEEFEISAELKEKVYEGVPRVIYDIESRVPGRFLGIFNINSRVGVEIDAETGDVLRERKPWWSFLISYTTIEDEVEMYSEEDYYYEEEPYYYEEDYYYEEEPYYDYEEDE